jgi:hypothetical protein
MASSRSFFEIVGPGFLQCWVPSRVYAGDAAHLTGQSTTRLRPGEFLELNVDGKVVRGTPAAAGKAGVNPAFPYFSETGRGDIVTGGKVPVIFGPTYEAETKLVARKADGTVDADANNAGNAFAVGDRLCVCDVFAPDDLVNKVYRGLRRMTATEINPAEDTTKAETVVCVGFVTRVFSDRIRFISTLC